MAKETSNKGRLERGYSGHSWTDLKVFIIIKDVMTASSARLSSG